MIKRSVALLSLVSLTPPPFSPTLKSKNLDRTVLRAAVKFCNDVILSINEFQHIVRLLTNCSVLCWKTHITSSFLLIYSSCSEYATSKLQGRTVGHSRNSPLRRVPILSVTSPLARPAFRRCSPSWPPGNRSCRRWSPAFQPARPFAAAGGRERALTPPGRQLPPVVGLLICSMLFWFVILDYARVV